MTITNFTLLTHSPHKHSFVLLQVTIIAISEFTNRIICIQINMGYIKGNTRSIYASLNWYHIDHFLEN